MSVPSPIETPAPPDAYADVADKFVDDLAAFLANGRDIARMVGMFVERNKRSIASHRCRTGPNCVPAAE
jgi:hypothetical protein